jgi:hypothetical protein
VEHEINLSVSSSAQVNMAWRYTHLHSPIRLYDVVLNPLAY